MSLPCAGDMFGEPLPIHKQTCYFFGRERRVADIPTDHPSCSKQHAILQYRSAFCTMGVSSSWAAFSSRLGSLD